VWCFFDSQRIPVKSVQGGSWSAEGFIRLTKKYEGRDAFDCLTRSTNTAE